MQLRSQNAVYSARNDQKHFNISFLISPFKDDNAGLHLISLHSHSFVHFPFKSFQVHDLLISPQEIIEMDGKATAATQH